MPKQLILEFGTDVEGFSIDYDRSKKILYFSVWDTKNTRKTYVQEMTIRKFREIVRMARVPRILIRSPKISDLLQRMWDKSGDNSWYG